MNRIYIKYDRENKLPNNEANIINQREKEVKALSSALCVTNKANHNLTCSHKELLRWNFRLVHIEFQHVQWLISQGV